MFHCEIKPTNEKNIVSKAVGMEDSNGFIGPKLPPLMSKAEIKECQRELFAKLDKKLEAIWSK